MTKKQQFIGSVIVVILGVVPLYFAYEAHEPGEAYISQLGIFMWVFILVTIPSLILGFMLFVEAINSKSFSTVQTPSRRLRSWMWIPVIIVTAIIIFSLIV